MQITYGETRAFTAKELEELFLSVKWESGNHPKLLQKAMRGYQTVFSARDGEKLVGLLCAMDDGAMTAYAHYLLVDPAYQGQGIGTHLVKMLKKKYRGYLRVALIAENAKIPFYKKMILSYAKRQRRCILSQRLRKNKGEKNDSINGIFRKFKKRRRPSNKRTVAAIPRQFA